MVVSGFQDKCQNAQGFFTFKLRIVAASLLLGCLGRAAPKASPEGGDGEVVRAVPQRVESRGGEDMGPFVPPVIPAVERGHLFAVQQPHAL